MKKLRLVEALLWVLIGLGVGVIAKTAFDYAVVETIQVDVAEAKDLFNQEYASAGLQIRVAGLSLSSEQDCGPVFLRRVEKRCVQDLTLFTTTEQELVGYCLTWTYRDYLCEIPAEKQEPVGLIAQLLN